MDECWVLGARCSVLGALEDYPSRRASAASRSIPAIRSRLSRDFSPDTMVIWRRGTPSASERNATRASLAAPSTGGAARRMRTAAPRIPSTAVRGDRGMTRTSSVASAGRFSLVATRVRRPGRALLRLIILAWAVEQHFLFVASVVLVADELQRA